MCEKMRAFVWNGGERAELTERPVPHVLAPTDAVVRVTLSTICTSDLHILHGAVPRAVPGIVLGHEFVGVVTELGSAVKGLRVGDRVAANCVSYCGDCWYCRRGFVNNCEKGGWLLGCTQDGCQADYVRVPLAGSSLYKIPDGLSDRRALLTGDILSSGYFGAGLCDLHPGDTVAVLGAGPVGICACLCARLFGVGQVILADIDPVRLSFARAHGVADLYADPHACSLEAFVRAATGGRGADGVIEAAGTPETFELAWRAARANGVVAVVAMYEQAQTLPLEKMYGKNLIFKTGGVDSCHCPEILQWLAQGKLDVSFLLTHTVKLSDIAAGYKLFSEKKDGVMKVAVEP